MQEFAAEREAERGEGIEERDGSSCGGGERREGQRIGNGVGFVNGLGFGFEENEDEVVAARRERGEADARVCGGERGRVRRGNRRERREFLRRRRAQRGPAGWFVF
ncbi:hypothetical protein Droror1_Dr00018434 [Drosera rotundifolia]